MITIENPLTKDVVFDEQNITFEDENCNLLFSPIPFKIPAEAVSLKTLALYSPLSLLGA